MEAIQEAYAMKTPLGQYVKKFNYLDKLQLSWDELDEHEAHDSQNFIRPSATVSTEVADRENAFGRVKKSIIPDRFSKKVDL